jgi:hypothetical protein
MTALDLTRAMVATLDRAAVAELEHALGRDVSARQAAASPRAARDRRERADRAPGSREAYTREEAAATVRRCAQARGREPTWTTFDAWAITERARARRRDGPDALPRIPSWGVFCRLWPDARYGGALAAAAITREELRRWRIALLNLQAARTQSLTDALAALDDGQLTAIGLDARQAAELGASGPGGLPIPAAAALARALGGSLHWLAGLDPQPGRPPDTPAAFDSAALSERRRARKLTDAQLRRVAGLGAGPWVLIIRGGQQPPLRVLAALADVLGVRCDDLCAPTRRVFNSVG